MTYIHDTVIREYLSGKIIQVKNNKGTWKDVKKYGTEDSIPMFVNSLEYRVKPSNRYCFFHTSGNLLCEGKSIDDLNGVMFEFPEFEPSGPHIMIKYNENGKIVKTYHSNTASTKYFNEQVS